LETALTNRYEAIEQTRASEGIGSRIFRKVDGVFKNLPVTQGEREMGIRW